MSIQTDPRRRSRRVASERSLPIAFATGCAEWLEERIATSARTLDGIQAMRTCGAAAHASMKSLSADRSTPPTAIAPYRRPESSLQRRSTPRPLKTGWLEWLRDSLRAGWR